MAYANSQQAALKTAFREPNAFNDKALLRDVALEAVAQGASDLYFMSGEPVLIKVHGDFVKLTERRLTADEVMQIANFASASDQASADLAAGVESRTSYSALDPVAKDDRGERIKHRFRSNALSGEFRGGQGVQLVMRAIRSLPPTTEELKLEREIVEASTPESGIILITGATGSGKSTTFGALTRNILEGDTPVKGNIITIEDPIEYLFADIKSAHSVVFQVEVGRGVRSFGKGVEAAMRMDPSMIVVGETRDVQTAEAVLAAANTGHLVYSTLHTNSCATIPARLLSFFEPSMQRAMLFSIIDSSRMFMNQRLVPSVDGRRTALREYLILTEEMRQQILETPDPDRITAVLRKELRERGQSMRSAAEQAFEKGLISEQVMKINAGD